MDLILFLGSGISLASGHPGVVALTESILTSEKFPIEAGFLRALRAYDQEAMFIGDTRNSVTNETVGETYRNETSYEDLYYLCDEMALFDYGHHNNSMVPAFIQSFIDKYSSVIGEHPNTKTLSETGKLAYATKKYIDQIIIEQLHSPQRIVGLDLIVELANSSQINKLSIITLNHDLLVENLLLQNNIPFADGFGNPDGDVRWFDPDEFDSGLKVRLIKLHGSIDWYKFLIDRREKLGKISGNNADQQIDSTGNIFELYYKTPQILSGLNKTKYYNAGNYTDIHYHFQKVLYENNHMIMSGYGWGDDAINVRLMAWLDKKKINDLILLHENPNLIKDRCLIMDRDYSNWVERGKLKPIFKWLSDTSLDDILKAANAWNKP